ncbi:RNA-directed DNA polymerase from mobile element jockey [Trichonephila clavipes]|nr:RNA-directed DNA polymerase from mobile element jockey [Trichonephila clavipes]
MDPSLLCQGKGLVLPKLNFDKIVINTRFLLISLNKNALFSTSPFAIHKALIGIGGEPKSVKKLRSGDLLIETSSAVQTKSFLLAKSFLGSPANITPHKSLNSSRGVISEPDLLTTSDAEILEGFSSQGCHSDCSLAQKCVNCSQPHSSDSKQCPKWKAEKEIQAIKTNRNISYLEARKLITPQLSQTYAQVAKPSTVTSTTQTDENITHIKCPPLQLLQPLLSVPQPDKSNSVSALSSATQADLLSSTSSNAPSTNDMFTSIGTSSPIITTSSSHSVIQPPSASNIQDTKKISKVRARKRKKEILKKMKDTVFEIKMAQHKPRKPASVEYTTDEEDTIVYDMGEEIESPKMAVL